MADLMADLALDRPVGHSSRWIAGWKRGGPRLWVGGALVGALALVALLAPLIAPHDPLEQDLISAQLPPSWIAGGDPAHWLRPHIPRRLLLVGVLYSGAEARARARVAGP